MFEGAIYLLFIIPILISLLMAYRVLNITKMPEIAGMNKTKHKFDKLFYRAAIKSFLLGLFLAVAIVFTVYAIGLNSPFSSLILFYGILFAVLTGCLVFLIGCFISINKLGKGKKRKK